MNELALFAGSGGGILGGKLLGWRTRCAVEINPYCRKVLLQRQADGMLDRFPIWDDVCTFDGRPWSGTIDIVTGGFPCQDISAAGKGAGITGARSGLWKEMARIIGEVRPAYVLVENSPMLVSRGLDVVLADLAEMGFDAEWGIVGACDAGAPHKRERIWIVAHAVGFGCGEDAQKRLRQKRQPHTSETGCCWWRSDPADLPDADGARKQQSQGGIAYERGRSGDSYQENIPDALPAGERRINWPEKATESTLEGCDAATQCQQRHVNLLQNGWGLESRLGRVADGVAHRVDRLKALGNGQVPAVVKLAWETFYRE